MVIVRRPFVDPHSVEGCGEPGSCRDSGLGSPCGGHAG